MMIGITVNTKSTVHTNVSNLWLTSNHSTTWLKSNLPVLRRWIKLLPNLKHIEFVVENGDQKPNHEFITILAIKLGVWMHNNDDDNYDICFNMTPHSDDTILCNVLVKPSFQWASLFIYPAITGVLPIVLLSIVHEYYSPRG